jgi:hypothetical protein
MPFIFLTCQIVWLVVIFPIVIRYNDLRKRSDEEETTRCLMGRPHLAFMSRFQKDQTLQR